MAYKVDFHPEAETDLDESLEYFESQKTGLAQQFFNDYKATENRIAANPQQFPIEEEDIHKANLSRFPFSVFFIIEQVSVLILSIFHNKRNPDEWKDRK